MPSAEPQLPAPSAPKTPAVAPAGAPKAIHVDLAVREQTGFGGKIKRLLARAGIVLALTAGASHMAGTKAEGIVETAFEPIHDTLRPGNDESDDAQDPAERNPQNAWERAKSGLNEALDWAADTAGDTLKESELAQKIDETFTDLEELSKDIAYWGAFVVTFMTLMSLLTTYLAARKLVGKKPVDPRVEAQIRELATAVNLIGEQLHALKTNPGLPAPQDREALLRELQTAGRLVETVRS